MTQSSRHIKLVIVDIKYEKIKVWIKGTVKSPRPAELAYHEERREGLMEEGGDEYQLRP